MTLVWEDNATTEDGYEVEFRSPPSTTWVTAAQSGLLYAADTTQANLTGGNPGQTFEFRVLATLVAESSASNVSMVTTDAFAHILVDQPFNYDGSVPTNNGSASVNYTVAGLPDGLTFNSETGEISGAATEDGHFSVQIDLTYTDPASPPHQRVLELRIPPTLGPPVAELPLPGTPLVALEAPTPYLLDTYFGDPDTRVAVKIDTTVGEMVFSLFDKAMPAPVTNFLNYVDRGDYTDNVFHRSVNSGSFDIIQSGGFTGDGAALSTLTTDPPITNAPGIPNDRGSLAYARTDDPNSATAGWYINAQNSPGLDGGASYSVFGRATDASLSVIDAIHSFATNPSPAPPYSIPVNGFARDFNDFPSTDGLAPGSPAPANLIIVNSITRTPALTYTLSSNSTPAVASATIDDSGSGPELVLTPLAPGTTEINITATDIDGNALPATHTVTVLGTYAQWIAGENIAPKPEGLTDHPGGGSFNNLQSYAFGGAAADGSDDAARAPATTTADVETVPHDALCFYHRKYASDLTYRVETTADLVTWTTVWETADGNEAPSVVSVVDDADFWKITVRKNTPAADDDAVYFRVAVTHPGT